MQPPSSSSERSPNGGWGKLLTAAGLLAAVWLVVLPWVGTWPAVRQKIRFEESRGIDPSAMFYTELEAMPDIVGEIDRLHLENGSAFWQSPSTRQERLPRPASLTGNGTGDSE